jgi:hypothetical protein
MTLTDADRFLADARLQHLRRADAGQPCEPAGLAPAPTQTPAGRLATTWATDLPGGGIEVVAVLGTLDHPRGTAVVQVSERDTPGVTAQTILHLERQALARLDATADAR